MFIACEMQQRHCRAAWFLHRISRYIKERVGPHAREHRRPDQTHARYHQAHFYFRPASNRARGARTNERAISRTEASAILSSSRQQSCSQSSQSVLIQQPLQNYRHHLRRVCVRVCVARTYVLPVPDRHMAAGGRGKREGIS